MQTKDKELILLSFDTEEFDVPREHGVNISLEEGMRVSVEGTTRILDCLKRNGVCATFFCTGNFAEQAPRLIRRIMDEGQACSRRRVALKKHSRTCGGRPHAWLSAAPNVPRERRRTGRGWLFV